MEVSSNNELLPKMCSCDKCFCDDCSKKSCTCKDCSCKTESNLCKNTSNIKLVIHISFFR